MVVGEGRGGAEQRREVEGRQEEDGCGRRDEWQGKINGWAADRGGVLFTSTLIIFSPCFQTDYGLKFSPWTLFISYAIETRDLSILLKYVICSSPILYN
jgi:hypothetical protein